MPTYRTIHTTYGLQKMAAAEAAGVPINLVEIAVGDGNGNPVAPSEGQTNLVRELYRAAINRVFQDPDQPKKFTAELIIPASVGGFTLREVGVFDADGGMFVVGNLPDAYKPNVADGAYSDTVLRVEFLVSNAGVVTIVVDPNVAVVTQQWIFNNVTPAYVIPGGTTNQHLAKNSNADGDFKWVDNNVADVVVEVIEEQQVLAAAQTNVILTVCTTTGLAVYIEGVRIRRGAGADEWQPDASDPDTTIVLGQSYAAGTKIICTQNEPAGSVPFPLQRDLNLADVPNKPGARNNLEVYSKAETDTKAPVGMIGFFAFGWGAPTGWLKCNGAAVSRTAYATLFANIGTNFGAGDGFNTFNLPDLRGEFVRGWDDGRGVDPGRGLGQPQGSQNAAHTHPLAINAAGDHNHANGIYTNLMRPPYAGSLTGTDTTGSGSEQAVGAGDSQAMTTTGSHTHTGTATTSGGAEARPRNIAMLACIKF